MKHRRSTKMMRTKPYAILIVMVLLAGAFIAFERFSSVRAQAVVNITNCQSITQSGSYRLANDLSSSGDCIVIRASNVTIDGNGRTVTVGSGYAVDIFGLDVGPWNTIVVQNLTSNEGVRTFGNDNHHITFENLNVGGIDVLGSDDVIIQNNTVGTGGIQVNNADRDGWHSFRPRITNNSITGGSTNVKILLQIASGKFHPCPHLDAYVDSNVITNTRNDPPPEATASVRLICAGGTTFTNNTIRGTGTTIGLYIRDEADDGLIENNVFWVNTEEALRMATGNDDKSWPARNVIRNNIFRSDTGQGFFIQGIGGNNVFSYNTFWSATQNEMIQGAWGNTFDHNTLVVKNANTQNILYDYDHADSVDTWTNNIFSYNGTDVFTFDGFSNSLWSGNTNIYHNQSGGTVSFGRVGDTLAEWRAATGEDAQSITGNPLFTNPSAGDFTLQAASPARGNGSSGSDIGAKPYGSSPPPFCYENWQCSNWSTCVDGTQARTCTDANSCGTTGLRPPLTQSCGGCTELWSCSNWSACADGAQARTCTDANSCGTTTNRPALSQTCTTSSSTCGVACANCTTNRILGPACTTSRRQCDGTNSVEDVRLSTTTVNAGGNVTVDIDYACYDSSDDNLALWYYNGSSWRLIQGWGRGSLTGCDHTVGVDGTMTATFIPDSTIGTHYVRAIEAAGMLPNDGLANQSQCPDLAWGNIDDVSFTVQAANACAELWSCSTWSACADGAQARTCTDANSCGTTVSRPVLSQICTLPDVTSPTAITDLTIQ